jgi:hypothetical protein
MTAAESRDSRDPGPDAGSLRKGYEPPAVVEVLRAEDLRREVHYAGVLISGPAG